jgi:ABC-type Fe3+/spermidine/putrescine transport system ATPase subunit
VNSVAANVRVLVRPERIRVSARSTSGDDIVVEIVDLIFSGPTVELVMRTASGVNITALAVEAGGENLRAGQQAFVHIDADDVHVLP